MTILGTFQDFSIFSFLQDEYHIITMDSTPTSQALAQVLDPDGTNTRIAGDKIEIIHTRQVDMNLVQLVDIAAEIRRRAPRLIQLSFMDSEE